MNSFFLFFIASVLCSSHFRPQWLEFKQKHGKVYETQVEEEYRYNIFKANVAKISDLNQKYNPLTYFGINLFADLTLDEFRMHFSSFVNITSERNGPYAHRIKPKTIPPSIDWRTLGAVTPILNQGQCGSSPYFSAVVSMEGAWEIAGNELVALSVQQILDCSGPQGNQGCNGSLMTNSYQYVITAGGIESAKDYPYQNGNQGACKADKSKFVARFKSYKALPGDEKTFTEALAIVPVGTAVNADSFQFYTSGIYSSSSCANLQPNHGIGVVGYGSLSGRDYYILKNSWGTGWGMAGYMLLARNQGNMCGIATYGSYIIV